MVPLELSVSDATIWRFTLESSITILKASLGDPNMLIIQVARNTTKGEGSVQLTSLLR
jgi:hypothetical protein